MAKGSTQENYSYNDLIKAYNTYHPHASLETPEARLLSKDYPLTDPGLDSLIEESEEDIINNIHVFFSKIISNYKLDWAVIKSLKLSIQK